VVLGRAAPSWLHSALQAPLPAGDLPGGEGTGALGAVYGNDFLLGERSTGPTRVV